jgi:AcrR family transcriptional regulator
MLAPSQRPRNAAATRGAILEAAILRFSAQSYDEVGMRDIAGDVGVDPALISRYFGSKEDLFGTALEGCSNGDDIMRGDREDFGRRMAQELVYGPKDRSKLRGLLILLRSIGSAKAMEIVQRNAITKFHQPFAQWVGGEDGAVRARLASSVVMGVAIGREVTGGFDLTPEQQQQLCERLSAMLQAAIDD